MSISGIGSTGGFDPTQMTQKFFKKADSNSDGGIDKSELKTMLSNRPDGSKGTQDIDKIFSEVDADGNGKISETENADQMKKMGAKGGKPPSSGEGKAPPSSGAQNPTTATSSSSSSSSNKVYDSKDTNKDGNVSNQEELAYSYKHPEESKKSQSSTMRDEITNNNNDSGLVRRSINLSA